MDLTAWGVIDSDFQDILSFSPLSALQGHRLKLSFSINREARDCRKSNFLKVITSC